MKETEKKTYRACRYQAPSSAIEAAIRRLREHGNVAPEAVFNPDAPNGLRSEIAYHDEDFLWYLGRSEPEEEIQIVESAISFLAGHGVCPGNYEFDEGRFLKFRESVRRNFRGGWTSFTPVMERLFYTLTSIRKPSRMVEFGCYWGNTLAWFAGPSLCPDKVHRAKSITGVDIDGEAIEKARENFRKIDAEKDLILIEGDARETVDRIQGSIDFLYLEAKEEGAPPIYLDLLKAVYHRLSPGAWVIAHDIYDKDAIRELRPYVNWVRNPDHFSKSFALDVDFCGAELSIR